MASEFPKQPGYVPTQEIDNMDFKRRSACQQEKNKQNVIQQKPNYPMPKTALVPSEIKPCDAGDNYLTTTGTVYRPLVKAEITEQFQPTYVHADRQVLRFYGYFKESVPESNLENFRVRKLVILLHLEDDSIEINENKQINSGIPQGTFLAKQSVLKSDGSNKFINAYDFRVGANIDIYGRSIYVFDCDDYTRAFYVEAGTPQPEQCASLADNFQKYVTPKFHNKEWNGLNSSVLNGRVPSQKQFQNLDRKVLRFFVFSDIPYILHYYLADDTMEIREINYANSGKDPFPLLLKRQRFPRKFSLNQPGHSSSEGFIMDSEIYPGQVLSVFGRDFKINGCDPYTQEHYRQLYNKEFPLGDGLGEKDSHQRGMVIPPYNGFGDEEDSLGNVYRLVPKPPKKDYFKWVDNQVQLKLTAKLNTTNAEDVDRQFIVTFYLNDDTVMVYEPQQRNSGIVSGKFQEKKKYKNAMRNDNFFEPADFIVGADILINSYSFHITGCDERTRNWYRDYFGAEMGANATK